MKRFIAILSMFLLLPLLTGAKKQDTTKYAEVNKKDTITMRIIAEDKKQNVSNTTFQLQFAKVVENQTVVNKALAESIVSIGSGINFVTKEVEKRNKGDSALLTDEFNYTKAQVLHSIQIEKRIRGITWGIILIYVLSILNMTKPFYFGENAPWPVLLIQCMLWTGVGIFFFHFVLNILTIVFNSNYYTIEKLLNLYT